MLGCSLCHKKAESDNVTLFNVPKDVNKRRKWAEICKKTLEANARICEDHFSPEDIVKKAHKILLTHKALPIVMQSENCSKSEPNFSQNLKNLDVKDFLLDTSMENRERSKNECRCCRNPSTNFIKLDAFIKICDGIQKTYKDLYDEITKLSLSKNQESMMPQQICYKCGAELKKAYKFLQQACKVSQEYLDKINQINCHEDIKNVEQLRESLIEISEAPITEGIHEELKVEPLNIECNIEIKEENFESDKEEQSQDDRNFVQESQKDKKSSDEDDDESDDAESVKDIVGKLNDKTLARSCDVCHKLYKNERDLKVHKRYTHMPEEDKLPCPLCSHKSSRLFALKTHMRLIHGEDKVGEYFKPAEPVVHTAKIYPCDLCQQSFTTIGSRERHFRRKHLNKPTIEVSAKKSEKNFLCTYCGQSYRSKGDLSSHVLIHTDERPFSCEICNKTFRRIRELRLHSVIHKDEKPHQCSECGRGFKRVDKLKFHMRVHSELRPYKCSECEKTFKYQNVLKTHMLIHTGLTSYA